MPTISIKGAKPAAKRSPARKSAPAKQAAPAKRAVAKRQPAAAAKPARKAAAPKAEQAAPRRRAVKTNLSEAKLKRLLDPLAESAQRREALHEQWKREVQKSNKLLMSALRAEVPVVLIVENANISRQHLYKLQHEVETGKRDDNGNPVDAAESNGGRKRAAKPAAKRTAAKVASKAQTAKRTLKRKA